jgi:hypothetical protein
MQAFKRIAKDRVLLGLFAFAFILALLIGLMRGFNLIDTGRTVEAGTTAALVVVTVYYAVQTRITVKEMKDQRYDAFRPVIDFDEINNDQGPAFMRTDNRPTTDDEKISTNPFECVLRNYGAGAAIDIYSIYEHISPKASRASIGNLQAKESKNIRSVPNDLKFIKARKIGSQWFLVVYYRDVYSRCFETKRRVSLEGDSFKIGSFEYRELDKQKDSTLINEIWPTLNAEVSR